MTFYLIGTGVDLKSITLESLEIIKKADKIYLENYTVNFPYKIEDLEKELKIKIIQLNREKVEAEEFVQDAGKKEIVLLIYGAPLDATTHISLILRCRKDKIKYRIIHNSSIFDAITETGLQLYKFGKTTSMPKFQKNFEPSSFLEIVKENNSIKAHSLILTDIGLESKQALEQLEKSAKEKELKLEKIIIISKAGTQETRVLYDSISNLKKKSIEMPFCIIIPGEMHFLEKEALEILKER
jgi:diphthine synthase